MASPVRVHAHGGPFGSHATIRQKRYARRRVPASVGSAPPVNRRRSQLFEPTYRQDNQLVPVLFRDKHNDFRELEESSDSSVHFPSDSFDSHSEDESIEVLPAVTVQSTAGVALSTSSTLDRGSSASAASTLDRKASLAPSTELSSKPSLTTKRTSIAVVQKDARSKSGIHSIALDHLADAIRKLVEEGEKSKARVDQQLAEDAKEDDETQNADNDADMKNKSSETRSRSKSPAKKGDPSTQAAAHSDDEDVDESVASAAPAELAAELEAEVKEQDEEEERAGQELDSRGGSEDGDTVSDASAIALRGPRKSIAPVGVADENLADVLFGKKMKKRRKAPQKKHPNEEAQIVARLHHPDAFAARQTHTQHAVNASRSFRRGQAEEVYLRFWNRRGRR